MKLGYSTWGMPTVAIDQAVNHVAGLGFDGIEIAVLARYTTDLAKLDAAERKRIARLLDRHQLTLTAIDGHASLLETDEQVLAENVARLQATIDLAVEWTQETPHPMSIHCRAAGQKIGKTSKICLPTGCHRWSPMRKPMVLSWLWSRTLAVWWIRRNA